jgi:hypothetical protein
MKPSKSTTIHALLLAGLIVLSPQLLNQLLVGQAWAQDDDDGDDDDDDDGGYSSSSDDDDDDWDEDDDEWTGGYIFGRRAPAPAPVVVLPDQADNQIVVEQLDGVAREQLIALGFSVLGESGGLLLLELPDDLDVPEALDAVRRAAPAAVAGPNSYYRSQAVPEACAGDICAHWEAVSWPPVTLDPLCRFEPHIGVVDTGVNIEHDMLQGARLTLETIGSLGTEPSEHKHGTAVVAMFVGDATSRVPGLVPAANLLVVDPFGRVGTDERSDVFALSAALDRLGEAEVDVASLSLAGPDNPILASAVQRLQASGIPLVAAVGNAGPRAAPLFPAAYPDVVGVTAVDGRANIYRRALQGEHVSFAAPGVEISTAASISGIRPQTGTSFAVPFVTTALAAAMSQGAPAVDAIEALAGASQDLGDPGRDPVFGWGLIKIPSPC